MWSIPRPGRFNPEKDPVPIVIVVVVVVVVVAAVVVVVVLIVVVVEKVLLFVLAQWLRCCATNRKVAGSIPNGVI